VWFGESLGVDEVWNRLKEYGLCQSECLFISQTGAKYNPKQSTDGQMGLGTPKVTLSNHGLMWKIPYCSRFVKEVHEWTVWQDL